MFISLFTSAGACCTGFSLVASSGSYSLVAARRLLIVVASLVEPELRSTWGTWAQ